MLKTIKEDCSPAANQARNDEPRNFTKPTACAPKSISPKAPHFLVQASESPLQQKSAHKTKPDESPALIDLFRKLRTAIYTINTQQARASVSRIPTRSQTHPIGSVYIYIYKFP